MRFAAPVLVSFLAQLAGVSAAEYGMTPELVESWSESSMISDGNAVELMPSGAAVATNSDGTMVILGGETFTPDTVGGGAEISCKSGTSFYTGPDGTEYAIYAIKDTPGSGEEYSSRVIAVNLSTMEEAWSTTLSGEAVGTPLVGSDNEHVYINHNNADGVAHFTVLSISTDGDYVFEHRIGGNYAPLGIVKPVPWGNYAAGFRNTNDFLCWASAPVGPITGAVSGTTQGFQLPRVGGTAAVVQLQSVGWVGTTPPAFSKDGQEMFFSVSAGNRRGAETRAWVGGKNFGTGSSYKGTYLKEGGEPPYASGALSVDDSMFFYPTTVPAFYGLNKTDGSIIWEDVALPGIVKTKPVASPDGKAVFFITEDGTVFGKDARTGTTLFQFKNGNAPKVTSDFSVNEDGTMLYYGITESLASSVYYQMEVGSPQGPTVAPTPKPPTVRPPSNPPTPAPITASPTISPMPTVSPTTTAPTITPMPSPAKTDPPTSSPTETPEILTEDPTGAPLPPPPSAPSAGSTLGVRLVLAGGVSGLLASLYLL